MSGSTNNPYSPYLGPGYGLLGPDGSYVPPQAMQPSGPFPGQQRGPVRLDSPKSHTSEWLEQALKNRGVQPSDRFIDPKGQFDLSPQQTPGNFGDVLYDPTWATQPSVKDSFGGHLQRAYDAVTSAANRGWSAANDSAQRVYNSLGNTPDARGQAVARQALGWAFPGPEAGASVAEVPPMSAESAARVRAMPNPGPSPFPQPQPGYAPTHIHTDFNGNKTPVQDMGVGPTTSPWASQVVKLPNGRLTLVSPADMAPLPQPLALPAPRQPLALPAPQQPLALPAPNPYDTGPPTPPTTN